MRRSFLAALRLPPRRSRPYILLWPQSSKQSSYAETALSGSTVTTHASLSPKERSLSSATAASDMDTLAVSADTYRDAAYAPQLSTTTRAAQYRATGKDTAAQHAEDHTQHGLRSAQSARNRSRLLRQPTSRDQRDSHCQCRSLRSQQPKTGKPYSRESVEQLVAAPEALAEPAAEPTKRQTTWTSKRRSQH